AATISSVISVETATGMRIQAAAWLENENGPHGAEERLSCLLAVAQVVNSSLELDAVLEHILTQARGILQAESGSIMLAEDGGQALRVLAAQGPRARNVRGRCRKVGEGVAGWVALYGRPLLLHGSTADPHVRAPFKRASRREDVRDAVCVPLFGDDGE